MKNEIKREAIDPQKGLGTELFHFVSSLIPVVNVDLIIFNPKGQILLSWRDDPHTGQGWHFPGRCLRFAETLEEAVQRCAEEEIGTVVQAEEKPCYILQMIEKKQRPIENQRERAHFISLAYRCKVPENFQINNDRKNENEPGYLRWFNTLPEDLLPGHECYRDYWESVTKGGFIATG